MTKKPRSPTGKAKQAKQRNNAPLASPDGVGPSDSDFSVIVRDDAGAERHVGRIFKTWGVTGSQDQVWMWTVEFHHRKGRTEPHQGYADRLEDAQSTFKRCWESGV